MLLLCAGLVFAAGCAGKQVTNTVLAPDDDALILEAENVSYYVPVFKQMESETGDFTDVALKIRALVNHIYAATGSDKTAVAETLGDCSAELSLALDLLKAQSAAVSVPERNKLLPELTGLMEATQVALNKIGKGLYLDTDKQAIIILPQAEIRERERENMGPDDFDSELPAIATDDSSIQ